MSGVVEEQARTEGYRALRAGAGLWERADWTVLRMSGGDPRGFLHKYCTQDVKQLPADRAAYACCLTVKGALVADVVAIPRGEELLLLTRACAAAALCEHLRKYALLDRVSVVDGGDALRALSLWGPQAPEVLSALGVTPPARDLDLIATRLAEREVLLLRDDAAPGVTGFDLVVAADDRQPVAAALRQAGALEVEAAAVEQVRVEAGWPLYGVDLGERTIPIEAGLEGRAISFNKGCYIGQEVIARIAHRGHVNRQLRGLRWDGPPPEALPVALLREGKEVGELTSCVRSPRLGGAALGLGLVHRKHGEPGTRLQLQAPAGVEVEVLELPLS